MVKSALLTTLLLVSTACAVQELPAPGEFQGGCANILMFGANCDQCVNPNKTGPTCDGCKNDLGCDDANACTGDSCVAATCVHANKTTHCDDGNSCTSGDVCAGGTCAGTPISCDDGNLCTADSCAASTGACVHTALTNCDDGNACTTDVCAAATGACTHKPLAAGSACGVSQVCDATATCKISGPAGMVLIPGGTFWMGCNETKNPYCGAQGLPQHKVTLSAYFIDLTETTVGQYKACVDAGGCTKPTAVQPTQYATYPGLTNNPVNFVYSSYAQAYCKWRGAAFDLPTEAQWEMAARGNCEKNGSTAGAAGCAAAMRTYPWGDAVATCSYAVMSDGVNYGCGTNATWAVGSKPASDSPYGLHDMAGNVYEWTRDWYDEAYYGTSPANDPLNPIGAPERVFRGGGFTSNSWTATSTIRGYDPNAGANFQTGFRCVKSYP